MARVLLVVNPQASGVTDAATEAVTAALGADVEVARTERQGHAVELVRDADAEAVVVFGGDGAFNEALNGLRVDLPIGLVPGGGSSVLPRALGLPGDPESAARRIADALRAGRTAEVSLGRVNGRRFGFSAALGFPAEVVRRVDDLGRERYGRRAPDRIFLTTATKLLARRRGRIPPELEVDGHGRASFALVANGDPYTLPRAPAGPADAAGQVGGRPGPRRASHGLPARDPAPRRRGADRADAEGARRPLPSRRGRDRAAGGPPTAAPGGRGGSGRRGPRRVLVRAQSGENPPVNV